MSDFFEDLIDEPGVPEEEDDRSSFNTDKPIEKETPEEPNEKPDEESNEKPDEEPQQKEKQHPKWLDQLPRSMRSDTDIMDNLAGFGRISDLVRDYFALKDEEGGMVKVLTGNETPEEKKQILEKMGVPERPDDYELESWKMPDGEEIDDNIQKSIRDSMLKTKLTKAQGKALYSDIGRIFVEKAQIEKDKLEEEASKTEEYYRIRWGKKYDDNMSDMMNTIQELGSPDLIDAVNRSGLGNNKDFINFVHKVSENFSDGKFVEGEINNMNEKPRSRILSYPTMDNLEEGE